MKKKLTIIGAGAVGTSASKFAFTKEIADEIVLFDIVDGLAEGKALDISQSAPLLGIHSKILGTNDYELTSDSDVVIITAGVPRKPGMSREDLLQTNAKIVKEVTEEVVKRSPNCKLIVVTNPIDAMVYVAYKVSGFNRERVIGMAGVLDSARYRTLIAKKLGVSPREINALVIGIHGDHMIPLVRLANVAGIPITSLLKKEEIDEIVSKTKHGGTEIVNLLKTGSAFVTPGLSAIEMAEAILKDTKRILPCATYLEGEFNIHGVFLGVPVVLGKDGVEKILEFPLTDEEMAELMKSAEAVLNQIRLLSI